MGNFTQTGVDFFLTEFLVDGISLDWETYEPITHWPNLKLAGLMMQTGTGDYAEITGTGYSRKTISSWNVDSAATPIKRRNAAAISWTGGSDWTGPVSAVGLFVYDALVGMPYNLGAVVVAPIPPVIMSAGVVLTIGTDQLTFYYD